MLGTDSDMEIQLQQHIDSPVKRVISTIPEGHERSPEIENCSFSRLSQNESRAMMSRALSRNLTRASFKIPILTGGRNSRTFLVDTGSKTPFDPEDEYDFDFESDEGMRIIIYEFTHLDHILLINHNLKIT